MADADRLAAAWRLAGDLAHAPGESEAAAAVARAAALFAGADSVRVWMLDRDRGYRFAGSWPEAAAAPERPPDEVARAIVFDDPAAGPAEGDGRSRLVLPLHSGPRPLGAIELLERRRPAGPFALEDGRSVAAIVRAAEVALDAVRRRARREGGQLEALARLARLVDIDRALAATLDPVALGEVVVGRVQAHLEVEAAYLWLLDEDGGGLSVVAAAGPVSGAARSWRLGPGEGAAGRAVAAGRALLFAGAPSVPGMAERPDARAGLPVRDVAVAPILAESGTPMGALEAVNRRGADGLRDGDLEFLRDIAAGTALALGNARRFDAERRAGDLGALLAAAQEIGSSLDAQQVGFTLVHRAAAVIGFRRAALGLLRGGRLDLVAVSGLQAVDDTLPDLRGLKGLLSWVAGLDEGLYVVERDDGRLDTPAPQMEARCRDYLAAAGCRSFLALPLRDEEGRIGALSLEAERPYAFAKRDLELARLLAAQATVAIRNALLFEQIPMARVFRPLARQRERFRGLSRGRKAAWIAAPLLAAAALWLVPVPLRIGGEARVLPALRLPVTVEVEGRVAEVLAREGDAVVAGQAIAILGDAESRAGREEARARYEVAQREQSRLRARGDASGAVIETARLAGLRADLDLWEHRLDRARVRSPVDGVVATPRIEELVGARLERGAILCEVVDPARQEIEVAIPERDVGLVRTGMSARVKLHAYPTRTLRVTIRRLGVTAVAEGDERVILARARIEASPVTLRTGMTGRARIDAGRVALARRLLRRPARFLWEAAWAWLP